jgi:CheY-like chemotaxis protein
MRTQLLSRDGTGPMCVLLVEDDELSTLVAQGALEAFGCEVTTAKNGIEALNAAGARVFDVVLMDYHLPGMDGLQITTKIRESERAAGKARTTVLGLTASAMPEERAACLHAGMDEVLSKPVRFEALYQALLTWGAKGGGAVQSGQRDSH